MRILSVTDGTSMRSGKAFLEKHGELLGLLISFSTNPGSEALTVLQILQLKLDFFVS